MTHRSLIISLLLVHLSTHLSFAADSMDQAAQDLIRQYELNVRPLYTAAGKAWWDANTKGRDEDFAAKEAIENRINEVLSDSAQFAELKRIRLGNFEDPLLVRQIDLLYLTYLEKQVDLDLLKRISSKETSIEQTFNTFRATIGADSYTDSQVREILRESKDSQERQQYWEASKRVGAKVEADLRELLQYRNKAARDLGFKNFHDMMLELNEQNQAEVLKLFDELDDLTREPFAKMKREVDELLAKQYGIEIAELRPWHYHDPFFQEPPEVYEVDMNAPFAKADILQICREFYDGIGLPIEDVIERSDLYEKPKKSPHAFCTDIDREGDVRVLANITQTEYWMATMLHELGHAVYSSKNIPRELPYVLRSDAHILATEGVAMMFERFSTTAPWLKEFGVEVKDPEAWSAIGHKLRRNKLLIFSRWCQVMLRFEMELYDDPDQDLNKLWWDLVEEYQLVKRPEGRDAPDYASKIHVVTAPAYYHNYMMGELFACQLHAAIVRDLKLGEDAGATYYTRNPAVGEFMQSKVFSQGLIRPWNDLTRFATGENLNAKAFAAEFQD